ncbi:MAG: tRNA (5-methylaminomethyl-2-thiouridine)(34)-methyltransferase MnmD [Saprospiraceae bacterium]|nr:tRNA (5-methylaminomethyl-2-thiouridine)(34)-methyltransferase MnmD [Saprospiraceae bacterium]
MLKLIKTEDGSHTLHSEQFGVTYHSIYGAMQETQTVFLDAGLYHKGQQNPKLSILEIGFGTGLNAFMTYLNAKEKGYNIAYTGIEAYPVEGELVRQLNYPEILNAEGEEAVFYKMHEKRNEWIQLNETFKFIQEVTTFQELEKNNLYDIVYYDAFAPNAQPELWDQVILEKMYNALKPEGVLVTYCAKGSFKRALKALGFQVEALPGPKNKREMTRATKTLLSTEPTISTQEDSPLLEQ